MIDVVAASRRRFLLCLLSPRGRSWPLMRIAVLQLPPACQAGRRRCREQAVVRVNMITCGSRASDDGACWICVVISHAWTRR